jgi:hypothetical protein
LSRIERSPEQPSVRSILDKYVYNVYISSRQHHGG